MTPDYKLPFWMAGNRATAVARAAKRWWETVAAWLRTAHDFGDVMTAPLLVVDLYAYQRGIKRVALDTERRYRLKVHHALRNAIDAGTHAGMQRIFGRLEHPVYRLDERMPWYDWDVIGAVLPHDDIDAHYAYLIDLWQMYRRTCRRFVIIAEAGGRSSPACVSVGGGIGITVSAGTIINVTSGSESVAVAIMSRSLNILISEGYAL